MGCALGFRSWAPKKIVKQGLFGRRSLCYKRRGGHKAFLQKGPPPLDAWHSARLIMKLLRQIDAELCTGMLLALFSPHLLHHRDGGFVTV